MISYQAENRFCEKLLTVPNALLVLCAIDGALTLWGLRLRAIEEVNPIMQEISPKAPSHLLPSRWRYRSFSASYFGGFAIDHVY